MYSSSCTSKRAVVSPKQIWHSGSSASSRSQHASREVKHNEACLFRLNQTLLHMSSHFSNCHTSTHDFKSTLSMQHQSVWRLSKVLQCLVPHRAMQRFPDDCLSESLSCREWLHWEITSSEHTLHSKGALASCIT